jgi:ethanolamine-phosphate cytidylyltransferase
VHGDAVVNRHRGMNLPLMNLHERVLSVLGCRYVDDVVIDAPYIITSEVISSLSISEVLHGDRSDWFSQSDAYREERKKRYSVPEQMGIFSIIHSPSDFKFSHILSRIQRNQRAFQAKFDKKIQQEHQYYQNKYQHQTNNVKSICYEIESAADGRANNDAESIPN